MTDGYAWLLLGHLASVAALLLFHGVPLFVAFRIRREADPERLKALLELSWYSVGAIHLSMFVLLGTGLGLAHMGGWWRARWLWAAIVLFVLVWGLMMALGTKRYDRLRAAVGAKEFYPKKGAPAPPRATPEALTALRTRSNPMVPVLIGVTALLAFFWLMLMKPF